jgi:hypothetical protein
MSGPRRYVLAISRNDDHLHVGTLDEFLPHVSPLRVQLSGSAEGPEVQAAHHGRRQADRRGEGVRGGDASEGDTFEIYDDAGNPFEIYDDEGNRLMITADDNGEPQLSRDDTQDADADTVARQLLVDRVALFLARAQVVLDRDPDPPDDPPLSRFPLLQADLRTVLAALADLLGPLTPATVITDPNRGNAHHNYLHRKGLAHR